MFSKGSAGKFRGRRKLWIGSSIVIVALVVAIILAASSDEEDAALAITAPAVMGPMTVQITESGELEAERREVISNECRWPAYIKSLAAEGSIVKKGDEIVRFECKELIDAITQAQINVTNANNDYTQAHENVEVRKKEVDNAVYKAEQALIEANENIRRYNEGEGPIKRSQAETAIQMAERDLTLAQGKLDFKKTANADPELNTPYSLSEIKGDELALDRMKENHKKTIADRDMFVKYDNPQQIRKLEMAIKDAELNLEKAKLDAKTQMLLVETNERSKKTTLDQQTTKLKDLQTEESKMVVFAQRDGLVVYDLGSMRRNTNLVIEVGAKIEPRMQIMTIPDMASLRVKTKVYETMVDQVPKDAEAYIRLDAKPGCIFPGKIEKVSVLPDSSNWMNPTAKAYIVYVKLDEMPDGLKPGMTAQVDMILARLPNTLSIPVSAVFSEQDQKYCYRRSGGKCERVAISTGRMSDTRVEILAGLNPNDNVLLTPPANLVAPAGQGDAQAARDKKDQKPADKDAKAEAKTDSNKTTKDKTSAPAEPAAPRRQGGSQGRKDVAQS